MCEQLTAAIPKTPEFESTKELPALKTDDEQPRNQCSWCGLVLQNNMSVHRKFCVKMPINMWLARQRATSRVYSETEDGQPCRHCGSRNVDAHEKQCGERFEDFGADEKPKKYHTHNPGRHGAQRRSQTQVRRKMCRIVYTMTCLLVNLFTSGQKQLEFTILDETLTSLFHEVFSRPVASFFFCFFGHGC